MATPQAPRQECVTPKQATQWLANMHYDQQRPIRLYHVEYLLALMQQGHFREGSSIAFAKVGTHTYLLNGYHTLEALARLDHPLKLTIETYLCASMEDVATLYGTFDRNLPRTAKDVYGAHDFRSHSGLAPQHIQTLAATIPHILSGFSQDGAANRTTVGRYVKDPEARLAAMERWLPEMRQYVACTRDGAALNRACLERAAVAAVALVTLRHTPRRATTFWQEAGLDTTNSQYAPAKKLLLFLYQTPAANPEIRLRYSRYVASCWNAFYEGKASIQKLYAKMSSEPILIAGTPHDGKHVYQYLTDDWHLLDVPVRQGR